MRPRARFAWPLLTTLLGVAAALASVVLMYLLALDHPASVDLTIAGRHRLAPRTERLIDSLDTLEGDFELVLTVDGSTVPDAGAFLGVVDLLEAIADRAPRASFTLLDLSDPAAANRSAEIVGRLAEREADAVAERTALVTTSAESLSATAEFLRTLADRFDAVRAEIPEGSASAATNRNYFEQRAALLRVAATDLDRVVETAENEFAVPTGPLADRGGVIETLPNADQFLAPLADVAGSIDEQLAALARDVGAFANAPTMPPAARDAAAPVPSEIDQRRDELARLADRLSRAEPLAPLQIGTALATGEVLLVVGPPGVGSVAVPINALLVDTQTVESLGLSAVTWSAQRAEELVASALGSLINPDPPIVVLTHGEPEPGLLEADAVQGLVRRLGQRGIRVAEWAAASDPEPPALTDLDPTGTRPRVYVTLNPDSTASSNGSPEQSGSQRTIRFARALEGVLTAGEPVLLSATPSLFPTYGDEDPLNGVLEPFGLQLESGTPVLSELGTGQNRTIQTEQSLAGDLEGHPVAEAISGNKLLLPWPVPVRTADGTAPLLGAALAKSWAEGEWTVYWQTPRRVRQTLPSKPEPGGRRDLTRERWTLAAAASRVHPETNRPQRLIVVGSNGWYLDPIALRQVEINQQSTLEYPGNIELLEASVFWLAGQDELIARSTTAAQIARVKPLDPSQQRVLRWTLLLGLPAAVLGLGLVTRLVFG